MLNSPITHKIPTGNIIYKPLNYGHLAIRDKKLMLVEVTIQVENSVISYLGTPVYLLASSPG